MKGATSGAREISRTDRRRIHDLVRELETVRDAEPTALGRFLPAVASLMRTDAAGTYALSPSAEGAGISVDHLGAVGARSDGEDRIARFLSRVGRRGLHFDPLRPERAQRNQVLTFEDLERLTGLPPESVSMTIVTRESGLWRGDQLRVLLCDGPVLLAWFGAFRRETFGKRERRILQMLQRPLQARARIDRLLSRGALHLSALEAALDVIGAAAFLTTASGLVLYANSAGRAALDAEGARVISDVAESLRGRCDAYRTTRVASAGMRDHFLVVRRPRAADVDARLPRLAERWRLTPRQREVLALLVRGVPNKTIAAALGCALRTVDVHVSSILQKSGAESRAELVVAFWSS